MCNNIMVFVFIKKIVFIYVADVANYMSNFDNIDIHQISPKLA